MADALQLLIEERDRLNEAIAVLGGSGRRGRPPGGAKKARAAPKQAAKKKRKGMSAEARQRLSEKLKKSWAKRKRAAKRKAAAGKN